MQVWACGVEIAAAGEREEIDIGGDGRRLNCSTGSSFGLATVVVI
jgi:hypothetical protein